MKLRWVSDSTGGLPSSPVVAGTTLVVADAGSHRVEALDTETGKPKWEFVADGPVAGPPSISGGLCLFGCRDGRVYALRLADGALVWSNLAAPEERHILAAGQVESAWPALSTVVLAKGVVCAVAGRHNMAEGGIVLTGFDMKLGTKRWQMTPEHRPKNNLFTSGAFARKSLPPDPRPTAASLGGWIVCDGESVQVDRLGAVDIVTGEAREIFDVRLKSSYTGILRPLKNGSLRSDFEPWLLSASDGDESFSFDQKAVQFKQGDEVARFKAPGEGLSVASANQAWLVLTKDKLLILDKKERRVRLTLPFEGPAIPDGLAIASGQVYVMTENGRVLCFGE